VYERWQQRRLSQADAAEILGISECTFRRWRERYQGEGVAGLLDRRLGRASARRVPLDRVHQVLELYRTRYTGFTAKHFHDKLRQHHGFELGYTWTMLRLQAGGYGPRGQRSRLSTAAMGLKAVAIGVHNEGRVIVSAVGGAHTGPAVVAASHGERRAMKSVHALARWCAEAKMQAGLLVRRNGTRHSADPERDGVLPIAKRACVLAQAPVTKWL
jgi:transposase